MLKVIEYDGNLKEIAQKLNNRKEEISIEVNNAVNDIINDIRKNGNQALINYCRKFDGYQIKDENDFVVSNQEKEEALKLYTSQIGAVNANSHMNPYENWVRATDW